MLKRSVKERRKTARRVLNSVAHFYAGPGTLPRTCTITDISDSGARLYCEADMPETFLLSVSAEGVEARRECQVVWRLGGELGVRFTGRPR